MTRIYLVRHAEAEGNLYRRIHGWYNSLVTENGYRQIAALAGRFEGIHIDAVYSSDLFRTMTTASAIYKPKGLTLHTDPGLREVHMGVWEDRPWGEVAHTDPERLLRFNSSDEAWRVQGGETFDQVGARMKQTVARLAAAHPGQTIALFSHGSAIRTLQSLLKGQNQEERRLQGHSDNTAVTCLEVEGESANIVFENDNSHLPEEISTLARQRWWKAQGKSLPDANLWFRPLDMERECGVYVEARRDAWVDIHGPDLPFDEAGFLRAAMERSRRERRAVTCAMLGDELAGLLELDVDAFADEQVGYIPFVYMTPQRRRQGLGVQLIGEAVSLYRPLGRTKLRLRCAPDNALAQRFYARYGFKRIGAAPGSQVPLDLLEKDIGYNDR